MHQKVSKIALLMASSLVLCGCGETVEDTSAEQDKISSASSDFTSSVSSTFSKERLPFFKSLESSLNSVFGSDNQSWFVGPLGLGLSIGKQGDVDPETNVRGEDTKTFVTVNAESLSLSCNGTKSGKPDDMVSKIGVSGVKASMGDSLTNMSPMFTEDDGSGNYVEVAQNLGAYLTGYDAYYDLSEGSALYGLASGILPTILSNNGYDTSSWSIPQQGHYAIDGDLKTKYTNDIFPMLGQYLPQLGTMEVTMLEMAYEANPSDFLVTNDNGHYTFTADTTSVAHLYSNIQSILNSLGTDVLITKDQLPMLSEDLTVDGALKWVKAVTDSMTINKLKVTFDYTATVFNKVDVDIDVVWDEAKIKTDLAAMGDSASWPLAFKLTTSASAKTGDEAKITLPDFTGYTDFVMPPKKTVA
jgi:hypothetical protein